MGVFPPLDPLIAVPVCLPHARGGVSRGKVNGDSQETSSPRPWGCFYGGWVSCTGLKVFPTPVGVFLLRLRCFATTSRLPHARGGVSCSSSESVSSESSSPRPWGSFPRKKSCTIPWNVFPTPVGVFPAKAEANRDKMTSSPRPWGCFYCHFVVAKKLCVFPTPVGVFLGRAIHHKRSIRSSPRPWGCFR